VDPSRRLQLRDGLRVDADRWTALAERHGTPLVVLQPHLVAPVSLAGERAERRPFALGR
jgi:hypothetical protein